MGINSSPFFVRLYSTRGGVSAKELNFKLTSLFVSNIENWGISPNKYDQLKENNKTEYINLLREINNVNKIGG